MTLSPGMRKEVWANRLDLAMDGCRELAESFEVLFAGPTLRKDGQRQLNLRSSHGGGVR